MNKYLNKITLGDSMEILKALPDKSVDMILTDPPYFEKLKVNYDNSYKNKIERERESRLGLEKQSQTLLKK